MSFKDWRVRRSLRDPIRGQFQVTGQYFAHPNGNSYREMLTGVITGPGIPATAGEHLDDLEGRYVGHAVLPVLIDSADPGKFVVLWDELPKPDFRAQAREQAKEAAETARTAQPPPASSRPATPLEVVITDPSAGTATPAWATDMIADLTRRDLIPSETTSADAAAPVTIHLPDRVLDLTAGRVSAPEAAQLIAAGRPTTAVLLAIADVAVPPQALPGPSASLCDLTLRLTRANGTSYDAVTRLGFRNAQRRASIAMIGTTLPVRVDPADDTRVVIDSVTWDAQHPNP